MTSFTTPPTTSFMIREDPVHEYVVVFEHGNNNKDELIHRIYLEGDNKTWLVCSMFEDGTYLGKKQRELDTDEFEKNFEKELYPFMRWGGSFSYASIDKMKSYGSVEFW